MPVVKNNAVIADTCSQRLKALTEHVPAKTEIAMNGKRYTRAQLIAIYQASLDTRSALVKSRAQVKVDLAARSKAEADRQTIETGLQNWVVGTFGASSNEAFEFGYSPRKKGEKSAETVATAVKLAQATRTARGTMGRKQKQKIKGTLVVPTAPAVPAVINAAPAHPAVPAASNGAAAAATPASPATTTTQTV